MIDEKVAQRIRNAMNRFYERHHMTSLKTIEPRKNRLRFLRELSKLTQGEVAKLLDIDNTTVSSHESARRGLTDTEIAKYAKLYKVQSYELFITPVDPED